MNITLVLNSLRSHIRRYGRAGLLTFVGVALLCAVSDVRALVGNGYTAFSWGTTTDDIGIDIGSQTNRTCFLSGVSGNLNDGDQQGFSCGAKGEESMARVDDKYPATGHYWLMAHGGACENNVNQKVWDNNPVNAEATCFWTAAGETETEWIGGLNNDLPVALAELSTGNSNVRQCFLNGLWGVGGAWNSGSNFARVRKVTTTDNTHPTKGWYIEGNLPKAGDGSHPRIEGRCVDFPSNTTLTPGSAPVIEVTKTYTLTAGPGIKACALTGIQGAFNVNSWTDGVLMNFPAKIDGNWTLTVSAGKSATWACAK
jgi:hypothetical protein